MALPSSKAKKLASYKFTPIIMLTTESQDGKGRKDKLRSQSLGGEALAARADAGRCRQTHHAVIRSASCNYRASGSTTVVVTLPDEITIYTVSELKRPFRPYCVRARTGTESGGGIREWAAPGCNAAAGGKESRAAARFLPGAGLA